MNTEPSWLVMSGLFIAIMIFFICQVLSYLLIRPAMSDMKGMQAGLKYSAELRRLRKQQPETPAARRLKVLDRLSLTAWLIGAAIMVLWKFKFVR